MCKRSRELVEEELGVWATRCVLLCHACRLINSNLLPVFSRGVIGHFDHPQKRDWVGLADHARPYLAEIVGQLIYFPSSCLASWVLNGNIQEQMRKKWLAWARWRRIFTWWWIRSTSPLQSGTRFYVRLKHFPRIRYVEWNLVKFTIPKQYSDIVRVRLSSTSPWARSCEDCFRVIT